MKCNDVRTFLSQISWKSVILMKIQPSDFDFLSSNGYISVMPKEDYDKALAEVSALTQLNSDQQSEINYERGEESTLKREESKSHSIMLHFENKEKKEAELEALQNEKTLVSKVESEVAQRDQKIQELIQKKSTVERMVPYD